MKLVVHICLNPKCLWLSLPWPERVWDRYQDWEGNIFAKEKCPRCKGATLVVPWPLR